MQLLNSKKTTTVIDHFHNFVSSLRTSQCHQHLVLSHSFYARFFFVFEVKRVFPSHLYVQRIKIAFIRQEYNVSKRHAYRKSASLSGRCDWFRLEAEPTHVFSHARTNLNSAWKSTKRNYLHYRAIYQILSFDVR